MDIQPEELPKRLTLTVPEAALALGISRNHAYKCAREGSLPTIKMGIKLLVPLDALRQMLKSAESQEMPAA